MLGRRSVLVAALAAVSCSSGHPSRLVVDGTGSTAIRIEISHYCGGACGGEPEDPRTHPELAAHADGTVLVHGTPGSRRLDPATWRALADDASVVTSKEHLALRPNISVADGEVALLALIDATGRHETTYQVDLNTGFGGEKRLYDGSGDADLYRRAEHIYEALDRAGS